MISIRNDNKDQCCGCGACEQSCPKHIITMQDDNEGFLYPHVDEDKCIHCGKCESVCPELNAEQTGDKIYNSYVGYALDDSIRHNSSSGGIFTTLASSVLKKNGVVYGAAYDTDFSVHHIRIDDINQLSQLQGSKYVQSRIDDIYRQAKSDLDNGLYVLFSGTACQIAGFKRYLVEKYSNLITVDLLCHGVPSPFIWRLYLRRLSLRHHSSIHSVNFRCKETGWIKYSLKVCFENDTFYLATHKNDLFMQMFLQNACLRPSCHNCKYKNLNRPSDITLGDAWGIQKLMPDMDDNQGTSIIITHSEVADIYINSLSSQIKMMAGEIDELLPPNSDSRISVNKNYKRNTLFRNMVRKNEKIFDWWEHVKRREKYKRAIQLKIKKVIKR